MERDLPGLVFRMFPLNEEVLHLQVSPSEMVAFKHKQSGNRYFRVDSSLGQARDQLVNDTVGPKHTSVKRISLSWIFRLIEVWGYDFMTKKIDIKYTFPIFHYNTLQLFCICLFRKTFKLLKEVFGVLAFLSLMKQRRLIFQERSWQNFHMAPATHYSVDISISGIRMFVWNC